MMDVLPSAISDVPVGKACVLGGGAFGTAMALTLAKKGAQVSVWDIGEAQATAVNTSRENKAFLPGFTIPETVTWYHDAIPALEGAELILVAIPTQFLRKFMAANHRSIPAHVPLVLLAKGVEVGTLLTPYEVVKDCLPTEKMSCVAVMSGPSFAKEVSQGQPTNVVVAAFDPSLVVRVQAQINNANSNFRVYASDDVIGCEIAGAVKNVLAIASGASSGLGFGNNTRAGLICRGLAEMTRLAKAMGSNGRAMSGLAGGGDLLLTCSSELSRNFSVGQRLARGDSTDSILNSTGPVAEGVATAKSVHNLAKKLGVEMPICEQVYNAIYEGKSVTDALKELQSRPMSAEAPTSPLYGVSAADFDGNVSRACVLGGGAFGTAMALTLAKKGAQVSVWDIGEAQATAVNTSRENKAFLPGFTIPETVTWYHDAIPALEGAELILVAIPTQFLRKFMAANHRSIPAHVPLVLLAKGVEVGTLLTPYEVVKDCLPTEKMSCVAVMSGPSFAKEVSQGQPTNVVVAAFDPSLVVRVQAQINNANSNFRVYASDDVIGCEIAGAVKNVLAIASGASSGLGFGNNTRAGLICRGLAEMTRLAKAMGSNGRAMSGLAGIGDLLLTCSSELSRNFSVGQRLARGDSTDSILNSTGPVAEGVATAKSVHNLAKKLGVEMPICEQVYNAIYEGKSVTDALKELQSRPMSAE